MLRLPPLVDEVQGLRLLDGPGCSFLFPEVVAASIAVTLRTIVESDSPASICLHLFFSAIGELRLFSRTIVHVRLIYFALLFLAFALASVLFSSSL